MITLLPAQLQLNFWNKWDEIVSIYNRSCSIFYEIFIVNYFSYNQFLIVNTLLSLHCVQIQILYAQLNFTSTASKDTGTSILPVGNRCSTICWNCVYVGQYNVFWKFRNVIKIADLGSQGFPTFCTGMTSGEPFIVVTVNAKDATRKCCFKFFSEFPCQPQKKINEKIVHKPCFIILYRLEKKQLSKAKLTQTPQMFF